MIEKLKQKSKESKYFKFRLIIIALTVLCSMSYSVGYAIFSENLQTEGEIDIMTGENGLTITNISDPELIKNGVQRSAPVYNKKTATFNVELPKTNSLLRYEVTVQNGNVNNVAFDGALLTTNNSAITYEIKGVDRFTVLEPGETLTFYVTIGYTEEYQYVYPDSTNGTVTINFLFNSTLRNKYIPLTGFIEEETGDANETDLGAPITLHIQNDNNFTLQYVLYGQNDFVITNSDGEVESYKIAAHASSVLNLYINDTETSNAIGTNPNVNVIAKVTKSSSVKENLIDSITLSLENKGKYEILSDGYTETPEEVDYSVTSSSSGGMYSEVGQDGKKTFYYRGKVNDNYFSFADNIWRILRIDEKSNIKLILNDLVTNNGSTATNQFKTTNIASNLDAAKTLVKLIINPSSTTENSPLYGYLSSTSNNTLRGWYNNTIGSNSSYASKVLDTDFCMDVTGGHATSSGTNDTVYYFGPYHKIGEDAALYDPKFECDEENIITEKVGLITADEYVFAGGAFNVSNTQFFLNDSGISTNWWTMSPGYYDSNQNKVGVFFVYSNGGIRDWPNTDTIINSYGIRPVITVDGSMELEGNGTSSNPYRFK